MIRYAEVKFRYDPFPLGVATPVFDEADYRELSSTFPEPELFVPHVGVGRRDSLSFGLNRRGFLSHLRRHAGNWGTRFDEAETAPTFVRVRQVLQAPLACERAVICGLRGSA